MPCFIHVSSGAASERRTVCYICNTAYVKFVTRRVLRLYQRLCNNCATRCYNQARDSFHRYVGCSSPSWGLIRKYPLESSQAFDKIKASPSLALGSRRGGMLLLLEFSYLAQMACGVSSISKSSSGSRLVLVVRGPLTTSNWC